jgi:lipoprotein NlpI
MRLFAFAALLCGAFPPHPAAADDVEKATKLAEEAAAAYEKGKSDEAVKLARDAIKLDPKNPGSYFVLGSALLKLRQNEEAEKAFTEVIKLQPKATAAYDRRGDARLKSGKFAGAVADFDEYLKANPKAAPDHWRRGLALYYAGKFKEGAEQFNAAEGDAREDVENSVWHYLCNARATSPKKAREEIIPVTKDARVPMKQVLELFAGKLKPQDVIDAAEKAKLEGDKLQSARFYANLYVALYYESEGDAKNALEHLTAAVEKYKIADYMWDVANADLKTLKAKK